jgi:uncharacterized membrane protein YfcA
LDLTPVHALEAAALGLVAGVVGGLAGIGGSLIILPGLGLFMGYDEPLRTRHHLYMASAMVVNVLVAAPAAWRHMLAKCVPGPIVKVVMPSMILAMLAGVLLSDQVQGERLVLILAGFIAGYAVLNILRVVRPRKNPATHPPWPHRGLLAGIGGITGVIGGLLGVGGGIVMVPLLQIFARTPLRLAIGASSAVMCVTAVFGSALKVWGLPAHGYRVSEALILAAAMGPTAVVGSLIGARLTHTLPIRTVRVIVSLLLLAAAARMAYSHFRHERYTPAAPPLEASPLTSEQGE